MLHHRIIKLSAGLGIVAGLIVVGWFLTKHISAHPNAAADGKSRPPAPVIVNVNQPLPPYRLADLNDQEVPADRLRRGRVLLVYLTTSCEPCIKEAEIISRIQQSTPPDIHIYGIYVERPAQVLSFIKTSGVKLPALVDVGTQLAKALDIHYFPSKYFIEDGVITEIWYGITKDEAKLRRRLDVE
jgi:peroxiredoxin